MSIKETITDSLVYPFSNGLRFLFLGILILISFSPYVVSYVVKLDYWIVICLNVVGLLMVGSLVLGYLFKVISESLDGVNELPVFNNWIQMFINGLKLFIVNITYLIPVLLIASFVFPCLSDLSLGALARSDIFFSILLLIALFYLVWIILVILMSVANMAYNGGELFSAFYFDEMFSNVSVNRYKSPSWIFFVDLITIIMGILMFDVLVDRTINVDVGKIIVWYFATGAISLIFIVTGYVIVDMASIFILSMLDFYSILNYNILRVLMFSLALIPYLSIFISRSTALIYNSTIKSSLINQNSIEYYHLQKDL
ncbi:DUF4013 domain-containing protein [Methanobacterium alcaliphilum]|uniref:DUF4013 domain-containing protein n=1 Tax=Methanobacterium alcaliphilum TaxID=392018 RepID=UPI00200AF124|nr:DUF4013 domain-containing protein [Methanobacterium alcaliphilum]MCK9150470.1 DUF4013 domain-containing protein [Methanobacterium alcaliphilum]